MNALNMRYLLPATAVFGLAVVLGTALWMRLDPQPKTGGWEAKPLEGLSRYGAVPEFSLIERSGKTTNLDDLRGNIWIADFIYTSCTDTCPLQSAKMATLQRELSDQSGFKLVSFSVDPERDRPEVLSGYATRFKADSERWWFLTGDKKQIMRLVQEGFHLSAVPATSDRGEAAGGFLHSSRFVLVDRTTQIRGYYDSSDAEALRRLSTDVGTLLRQQ